MKKEEQRKSVGRRLLCFSLLSLFISRNNFSFDFAWVCGLRHCFLFKDLPLHYILLPLSQVTINSEREELLWSYFGFGTKAHSINKMPTASRHYLWVHMPGSHGLKMHTLKAVWKKSESNKWKGFTDQTSYREHTCYLMFPQIIFSVAFISYVQ